MAVKKISTIAFLAAIQFIVFTSFSSILYLECITLTTVVFAMTFTRGESVLASICFCTLNFLIQGVTPWSLMYLLIFPSYSLLISLTKNLLKQHFILLVITCGVLSFLTGQLVQIPFLLVSKTITSLYLLLGFKTSLFQGVLSGWICFFLYKPIEKIILKVKKRY